ncbi:MAG: RNA methyltransferase [Micavibrio sp.]|nr:RNA methyltransferase [Micavibrio sp.]
MKDAPAIILVRPQMGENIGAAARAMLNFGLTDLRIVAPRDGWPSQAAIDMSAGALEIMPEVKVFETLADAARDLHFLFATTARPRDMVKPVYTPAAAIEETFKRQNQKIGFVFGPERSGLENDDVALCHAILTMKTNPDFSSINIAASVMVICYEWMARQSDNNVVTPTNASFPAEHEKLEELLVRLEIDLDTGGFFRAPDQKPTMIRNIRNLFTRTGMTDQEVRTFHGMLSALTGKNKS